MSVVFPRGFAAAGGHVGIKPSGGADAAVVAATTAHLASAAAVFTTSLAAAAPVLVSRRHLERSAGRMRAVVLTSGNANAATGAAGLAGARGLCEVVGGALGARPEEVLVCQTGLIGVPFDYAAVHPGVEALSGNLGTDHDDGEAAAEAILTTDTRRKVFQAETERFKVGAMAKGAAMLAPKMATMLAVITTDAQCDPDTLAALLHHAVEPTFNRVHVDGATSTNDTVCVLSSGLAGPVPDDELGAVLEVACSSLARQMVEDAEGATRTATITVLGAASDHEAHQGARAVAGSLLVKCSLNGADPYWGRVVAELGAAGIGFSMDRVAVSYGGEVVCRGGVGVGHDADALRAHMARRHVEVTCDLGVGPGVGAVLCCDLGPGYLEENRTTS